YIFFFKAEDGIRYSSVTGVQKCALPILLAVDSNWLPKPRLVGANPAPGAVPLPVSATVCGLPPALSATDSVPVRAPEAVGVKVTLRSEVRRAGKDAGLVGQAFEPVLVGAKSPEAAKEMMVKAAVPVFVSVIVIGALVVASSWLPKSRLMEDNPTSGDVPFPLSATVCGLPLALSVTNSVPVRILEAVGVKVTL